MQEAWLQIAHFPLEAAREKRQLDRISERNTTRVFPLPRTEVHLDCFYHTRDLSPRPHACHHTCLVSQALRGFPQFENLAEIERVSASTRLAGYI